MKNEAKKKLSANDCRSDVEELNPEQITWKNKLRKNLSCLEPLGMVFFFWALIVVPFIVISSVTYLIFGGGAELTFWHYVLLWAPFTLQIILLLWGGTQPRKNKVNFVEISWLGLITSFLFAVEMTLRTYLYLDFHPRITLGFSLVAGVILYFIVPLASDE